MFCATDGFVWDANDFPNSIEFHFTVKCGLWKQKSYQSSSWNRFTLSLEMSSLFSLFRLQFTDKIQRRFHGLNALEDIKSTWKCFFLLFRRSINTICVLICNEIPVRIESRLHILLHSTIIWILCSPYTMDIILVQTKAQLDKSIKNMSIHLSIDQLRFSCRFFVQYVASSK